jgi:hypothetical protein
MRQINNGETKSPEHKALAKSFACSNAVFGGGERQNER